MLFLYPLVGAAVLSPTPPTRGPGLRLAEFGRSYQDLAAKHYLPVAATQMCLMRSAADVTVQTVQQLRAAQHFAPSVLERVGPYMHRLGLGVASAETHSFGALGRVLPHLEHLPALSINSAHVAALAFTGLTISGCGGALWLEHLEKALGPSNGNREVIVKKSVADYCCWAPVTISANLFLVALMTGASVDASIAHMQEVFVAMMLLEAAIFGPFNLLVFFSIPPEVRPAVKSLLSFVFSIGFCLVA